MNAGSVALDDVPDVSDSVEINLELVQLAKDIAVAGDFGIGAVDDVAGAVILNLGEYLSLFAEMAHILLDASHEPVEMPAERGKRGCVEEEQALAAGPAGGSRAGRASASASAYGRLALAQYVNLLGRESQLRVRHSVGHGSPAHRPKRYHGK